MRRYAGIALSIAHLKTLLSGRGRVIYINIGGGRNAPSYVYVILYSDDRYWRLSQSQNQ